MGYSKEYADLAVSFVTEALLLKNITLQNAGMTNDCCQHLFEEENLATSQSLYRNNSGTSTAFLFRVAEQAGILSSMRLIDLGSHRIECYDRVGIDSSERKPVNSFLERTKGKKKKKFDSNQTTHSARILRGLEMYLKSIYI